MNVLITGGAGFVGRHVAARYASMGWDVTIIDNFSPGTGALPLEKWMPHLRRDSSRFTILDQDCREFFGGRTGKLPEFDVVVHLAAVVGGRLVIENDPLAVAIDLAIDASMFYWLSRLSYKPQRIHYFSSSAAYPVSFQRPEGHQSLKEDMISFNADFIGRPDLTYGWAKLTGEYLAQLAHEKHGHSITCYRPFSGYGEDQDMTYPFPSILRRAVNRENPMTVWGSGRQMRDFIYIEDCVDGMLKTSEGIVDGSAVNLGTGLPTPFNEVAKLAYSLANGDTADLEVKNTSSKPEGVFARYAHIEKQGSLGFTPKHSFRSGMQLCLDYWREYQFK